nr:MAG TPA: hypothetical protein [Caudoviricetes sp.]
MPPSKLQLWWWQRRIIALIRLYYSRNGGKVKHGNATIKAATLVVAKADNSTHPPLL